jgi:hypothetical protein
MESSRGAFVRPQGSRSATALQFIDLSPHQRQIQEAGKFFSTYAALVSFWFSRSSLLYFTTRQLMEVMKNRLKNGSMFIAWLSRLTSGHKRL